MLSILLTYRDEELIEYFDLLITRIKIPDINLNHPTILLTVFLLLCLMIYFKVKRKSTNMLLKLLGLKDFISHAYEGAEERTIPVSNYKWWEQ